MGNNAISRRRFLQFTGAVVSSAALCPLSIAAPKRGANVVFILVDDLAWSDLVCYGSKVYETPNVDRLAGEGMRFSDFYSGGPVCSPTRASILTGKYTARTGITRHLLTPKLDPKFMTHQLELEEFTIAEALKQHDYATGYFGKWHLGYEEKHWASHQGFDVAKGGMDLDWAWKLCYPDKKPPMLSREKGHTRFFSPHHLTHLENGPEDEYLTERLTDETISFIKQNKDEQFFAFLSFHTVHTPLQAKPEVVAKYEKKIKSMGLDNKKEPNKRFKKWQNNPNYAAMVLHMDENVGRLLKSLKDMKLEKDTIVIFTSDNGGKGSVTSNLPLNGAKHDLREGGIRVPLIVRWPGIIKAGSSCEHPLISNDFYPTILDLLGLPLMPEKHIDGISFKDILLGRKSTTDRDALYWHYPHSRFEGVVRKGDYKLAYFYKTDKCQLYNLRKDIGELNDLSEQYPGRVVQMRKKLKRWLLSVNARFPEDFNTTQFFMELDS
ncbi:MAG: sulfatase [Anaerohalosphaera sp.]|nr:sulfatase [Anaerohalosphaera sp.]